MVMAARRSYLSVSAPNSSTANANLLSIRGNYAGLVLILVGVLYNAILAIFVARGMQLGYSSVAAVEVLITFSCLALALSTGVSSRDIMPISLLWLIFALALIASISFDKIYIGSIRNFALIAVFAMLGQRMDIRFIRKAFFIASAMTLAVLVWEIASVESYASFFSPARYYELTRGTAVSEFDDSGLSVGTIVFEGRFSLGIFSGRRTSSIFLEQVSINSYAIVCMAFLSGMWGSLNRKEKLIQISTILLIIASNNARMGALMCLVMPIGYFLFPRLNRSLILAIPFVILGFIFSLSSYLQNAVGDDLTGRLGVTYRLLNRFNVVDLFAGNPLFVEKTFDSGYAFIIASIGLFGGLAYLLFLVYYPRYENKEQARASWSIAVYILAWLTVGGTATFSIKTAALLWSFIGCLSRSTEESRINERDRLIEHSLVRRRRPPLTS
ncbi:hypothetical protein [Sphingomonas sp. STIS6.2]|uniref:hypothetical protein n=1 Tax=Sphingomonas sp. STIS6.2 TaxID=1379700 RepID=UPI00131E3441|nr:hypothetical protein [Sphingomonas sp. STIS6.2]